MSFALERAQIRSYPTPLPVDLIFYEMRDSVIPENATFEYGEPHKDSVRYPHHELAYVSPSGTDGKQQWFYVAKRENQDLYNYELQGGEQLVRTYIIKRSLYRENPVGFNGSLDGEFLYPPAGASSPDTVFSSYCFADDTVVRGERELDSLYVVVRRRFIRPVVIEYVFNDTFQRYVKVTKEVIPPTDEPPSSETGKMVEIKDGNIFHDIRITQELIPGEGTPYPYALTPIPGSYNRNFPPKLESVDLIGAWAWASSDNRADSYSEDFYFDFTITEARPGPYSATIERYITDDPESLKASNPPLVVPQPVGETIGIAVWWAYASSEYGNRTFATAKEWGVPATIHPLVSIELGGKPIPPRPASYFTSSLAETPGYTNFINTLGSSVVVDFQVSELPFSLFEVRVIKIDISNLYTAAQ